MTEAPDLDRFVSAQDRDGTYERALAELRLGRKTSHWMWFVFPQLAGLGHSAMARSYAIDSLTQAQAYLAHPVLSVRLQTCIEVLFELESEDAVGIFGSVDALKLRSSMTLFARADPAELDYQRVLAKFFGSEPDPKTLELLA